MKVKCRGFEGNLISLNPTEKYRYCGDRFEKAIYELVMSVGPKEQISISGIRDEEIKFIK
jgi:hypothetical protein